jgi:hypothetical protein
MAARAFALTPNRYADEQVATQLPSSPRVA